MSKCNPPYRRQLFSNISCKYLRTKHFDTSLTQSGSQNIWKLYFYQFFLVILSSFLGNKWLIETCHLLSFCPNYKNSNFLFFFQSSQMFVREKKTKKRILVCFSYPLLSINILYLIALIFKNGSLSFFDGLCIAQQNE